MVRALSRTEEENMKRNLVVLGLLLISCSACETQAPSNSESASSAAPQAANLFDDSSGLTYGSYEQSTLVLDENGFPVIISSIPEIYSPDGRVSSGRAFDTLVLDFSDPPAPATVVSGLMWPMDLPGSDVFDIVQVTLSDGIQYVDPIENTGSSTFLEFPSQDNPASQRLEVIPLAPDIGPSPDDLYVGVDPPPDQLPEPGSLVLLATGLGAAGAMGLRKRDRSQASPGDVIRLLKM
jgi:hypothetical protein